MCRDCKNFIFSLLELCRTLKKKRASMSFIFIYFISSTEQDEKDTISYHDHPVNEDKIKAESWLNCRTKVYWNKMETHYHGLVTEVGLFKNVWKAKVEYDDGDVFWENIEDLQILKKGNPAKLKKQISNPLYVLYFFTFH